MLILHKKINQQEITQSDGNIVNLSKRQEDELLDCFLYNDFTNKTRKNILIKYAKMFIGNKISYKLCKGLCNITRYNDLFKVRLIKIKEDSYSIFYIDDFVCLVRVADAVEESIYIEHYNDVVNLNGYTFAYYIKELIVIDSIFGHENNAKYNISFLLYKDNMVYIRNDYCYNEELDTSISCTKNNIKKDIDLTNKQIKDCLDSLFVLNTLRK